MCGLHLMKSFTAVTAICVLGACASTKRLPQLDEDARSSLGTVGVITVGPAVGGKVNGPVGVGRQATVGVLEGAAAGTASGFGAGFLLGLACGPGAWVCSPVAAIGGAAIGLVGGGTYLGIKKGNNAIPENVAEEIQTSLGGTIADRDLQAELRQGVLHHTGGAAVGIDLGIGTSEPISSPDYADVADGGVDAVLETSLTQLAFAGEGGSNPTLALVMTARARLIRIADGRVLWNVSEVRYESPPAAYSQWSARDSYLVRVEIDNGSEALARQIGEALFGAPDRRIALRGEGAVCRIALLRASPGPLQYR